MPIKKSAFKALKQSRRNRLRNLQRINKIKMLRKKIQKLLENQQIEEAKKLIPDYYQAVDKALKTKTIKKNKAARLKSRLMAKINKLKTQLKAEEKKS